MQKIPLLLTRADGSNAGFAAQFPPDLVASLDFIDCPLLRIVPIATQVSMPSDAGAVFTSANGVRFAPDAAGRCAFCVGAHTTQVARAVGWDAVCAGQNASELIETLAQRRPDLPLYHFSGVHVRGNVVGALARLGISAQQVVVYDQRLLPLTDRARQVLGTEMPLIVPLFSPRAASHFIANLNEKADVRLVALSPAVAESCGKVVGCDPVIAAEPTASAVIDCVEKLVQSIRLG